MESARGVPIACTTPSGQRCYRRCPAPVRPVRHDASARCSPPGERQSTTVTRASVTRPRTGAAATHTAQTIRASLFADGDGRHIVAPPRSVCVAQRCNDVGWRRRLRVPDERPRAVARACPQIDVALLADGAEASAQRAGVLPSASGPESWRSAGPRESGEYRRPARRARSRSARRRQAPSGSSGTSGMSSASAASWRSTARMFASSAAISSHAAPSVVRSESAPATPARPAARARAARRAAHPTGMKTPNSRSRPRSVFNRAVRVASQVDRRRCNEAIAWCSIVLTGTG